VDWSPDLEIHRCRVCGSLISEAFFSPEGQATEPASEYETLDYFSALDDNRYQAAGAKYRSAARILTLLGVESGRLADFGCGLGFLVSAARGMGIDALGFDINPESLRQATANFGPFFFPAGDLEQHGPFDAITMTDVIEHVPDPIGVVARLADTLAPNGVLLIACPRADSTTAKVTRGRWAQIKDEHLTYPSRRGLELIAEAAGLRVGDAGTVFKRINVRYLAAYADRYPVVHPAVDKHLSKLPGALQRLDIVAPGGEQFVLARRV